MPNDTTAGDLVTRHTFRLEGARYICACSQRFTSRQDYQDHITALLAARDAKAVLPPPPIVQVIRDVARPGTKRQALPLAEIEREYLAALRDRGDV